MLPRRPRWDQMTSEQYYRNDNYSTLSKISDYFEELYREERMKWYECFLKKSLNFQEENKWVGVRRTRQGSCQAIALIVLSSFRLASDRESSLPFSPPITHSFSRSYPSAPSWADPQLGGSRRPFFNQHKLSGISLFSMLFVFRETDTGLR